MKKNLLITTSSFPFNTEVQEAFLIAELAILSTHFDHIYICPSVEKITKQIELPSNVSIKPIIKANRLKKTRVLSSLFGKHFWSELFSGISKIKLKQLASFSKEMIVFLANAKRISREINQVISEEKLETDNLLLYSYWLDHNSFAFTLLKKKYSRLKIISRVHSSEVYLHRTAFGYQMFKKKTIQQLDKLICVSIFLKSYIHDNYKLHGDNISVSRLGTLSNPLLDIEVKKGLKVLSIGSADVKRIDLLEASLKQIESLELEWHHFGSLNYTLGDSTLNPFVKCTHFGYLSNQELLKKIENEQYDLLINVSSSEGIPVSVMEAMSFGIPCIATAVGGTPEIVDDKNGTLLSPNPTPKEISLAIIDFHNLPLDKKLEIRKAAHLTSREKFNAKKNHEKFAQSINKL